MGKGNVDGWKILPRGGVGRHRPHLLHQCRPLPSDTRMDRNVTAIDTAGQSGWSRTATATEAKSGATSPSRWRSPAAGPDPGATATARTPGPNAQSHAGTQTPRHSETPAGSETSAEGHLADLHEPADSPEHWEHEVQILVEEIFEKKDHLVHDILYNRSDLWNLDRGHEDPPEPPQNACHETEETGTAGG